MSRDIEETYKGLSTTAILDQDILEVVKQLPAL